jgi:subtilisin family serine protease
MTERAQAAGRVYRLPPFTIHTLLRADQLGQTIDWSLADYKIPDVWKQTAGQGIRVAVLDTGVDAMHPDLTAALDGVKDFTGSAFGTADRVGHGTHTAGTIAARNLGPAVVGVAPQCRLLIGKVLGDDGSGNDQNVAAGIDWAVAAGADLISMSMGSPQPSPAIQQSLAAAIAAGKFVICAAGNDGRGASDDGTPDEIDYPGRLPQAIAVGAVDEQGLVADFSSRGAEVCMAAPGVNIVSTFPGGGYAQMSGTSMATPFVTGVVALKLAAYRAANGSVSPVSLTQLRQWLAQTATPTRTPGHNDEYGWGLINPAGLLAASDRPTTNPPPASAIPSIQFASTVLINGQPIAGAFVFTPGAS